MIGIDWFTTFYRALWAWLQGRDPYTVPGTLFASPPWALPVLAPFAFLPPQIGAYAMIAVTVSGAAALGWRLRRPWLVLLLIGSYVFVAQMLDSNIDGFVLWGLAIGGPVGFFLLTLKPQVAGFVAVLWTWQAWRAGGWRAVAKLVGPSAAIALVFAIAYPSWLPAMRALNQQATAPANLWPWLLPVAAVALAWGLRRDRPAGAAVATTLAAPYLMVHSYVGALALIADESPWLGVLLCAASWGLLLVRGVIR
jgi:hypothetical protein